MAQSVSVGKKKKKKNVQGLKEKLYGHLGTQPSRWIRTFTRKGEQTKVRGVNGCAARTKKQPKKLKFNWWGPRSQSETEIRGNVSHKKKVMRKKNAGGNRKRKEPTSGRSESQARKRIHQPLGGSAGRHKKWGE